MRAGGEQETELAIQWITLVDCRGASTLVFVMTALSHEDLSVMTRSTGDDVRR